uniref:XK-related protein n=1 Tax=Graphocephala atropunctata TaxID=36148 RepID=A0A1B6L8N3_9HEMI
MLVLFLSSIFSHYYSWWSFFNYWNDDFYSQWNHQLFFSLTELFSTLIVLQLADSRETVRPIRVLPVVAVAAIHIVAASWDQFLDNVVHGEGSAHQVLRDLCFMVPDILHVLLPLMELLCVCSHSRGLRRDCLVFCVLLTVGLVFSIYTNSGLKDW